MNGNIDVARSFSGLYWAYDLSSRLYRKHILERKFERETRHKTHGLLRENKDTT